MTVANTIKERFSVRKYKDTKVEQEVIDQILDSAKHAPTAKNLQPQHIYLVQSEEAMANLNAHCKCIFGAPQAFLMTYNKEQAWKSPFNDYQSGEMDVSIVADEMMLTAWELGIGTCWVGWFDHDEVHEAFKLPDNEVVAVIMPFGYPADDAAPIAMHDSFKDMAEIVTYL